MLFCSVFQEVFGLFPTISDHFGRFPKMSEDYWSFPTRNPKFVKPKKFRQMFLDGATLDCFERSRMTLLPCLSKLQNHPRFYRSSLELWQQRRRIHSMPPSASTLTTQYSPEYCCEWVEKRDYSYCPFEHGLKVHWWFEQSWKTMGFPRKLFKHLTVFSPETVNIKKLADLTANTKNCGRITLNPIQTLQSAFVVTFDFHPLADNSFLNL